MKALNEKLERAAPCKALLTSSHLCSKYHVGMFGSDQRQRALHGAWGHDGCKGLGLVSLVRVGRQCSETTDRSQGCGSDKEKE